VYRLDLVRRVARWLNAPPHPALVCEIAPDRVAGARWSHQKLEGVAAEALPAGAVLPSPVEPNIVNADAVSRALRRVMARLEGRGREMALVVPDAVVRVFILPFETFPRRAAEAAPLLRWRLKKSIPFDVEETIVSWMRQPGGTGNVEVVTAVARQRILREYEQIVETTGTTAGVVLSSTLAALPLLEEERVSLLARMNGTTLTTAIVAGDRLSVYRCTEMTMDASRLDVQALLSEVYPAVAYSQDSLHESVQQVRLAGLAGRFEEFRQALAQELGCPVAPLGAGPGAAERLPTDATGLMVQQLDALVGWKVNGRV
jgi:type IV pilus assembly protein PilM